jgi:hypothetical protein
MKRIFFFVLSFSLCYSSFPLYPEDGFSEGISINLREPEYSDGILTTEKGGVVTGPNVRIQAQNIIYTRKLIDGAPLYRIEASDNVMLEFGEYIFVGERLEYDFQSKTGTIYNGRSGLPPWYFGGETITLNADGTYTIHEGFVTTSENYKADWQISSEEATLSNDRYLSAHNVKFSFIKLPLFWLPSFHANLDSIFDSPIRYSFRWGGKQGPRLGAVYELYSWDRFKLFFRFDYRITRGPGGGLETHYRSADHKETLETINYMARDNAIDVHHEKTRYRFQGVYNNLLCNDQVTVNLTWDKLSDKYMATDYNDNGLELDTAGRTQLLLRRQNPYWIANLFTHLRVNNFQTVKQELPTLENTWKPYAIGDTGIIIENVGKASFLDFKYANDVNDGKDYRSTRIEYNHHSYRPIPLGAFTFTPEMGGIGLYYGDSPQGKSRFLAIGYASGELNTRLYRYFDSYKHVLIPYAKYEYFSSPTFSPHDHYIFDIEDGWVRLSMLRFGLDQNFYYKDENGLTQRFISVDMYANAFFDIKTLPTTIPKAYIDAILYSASTLKHTCNTAWDFNRHTLDHLNIRTDWTISDNTAVAVEYRHRDSTDWRKADDTNFMLDAYRSVEELLHSQLSDRRDTVLFHAFYRFNPNWAVEMQSRNGWNRKFEPSYTEFEVDLLGTLQSAWNIKFSYQHKENDHHRVAVYLSVGLKKPDRAKYDCYVPKLEF